MEAGGTMYSHDHTVYEMSKTSLEPTITDLVLSVGSSFLLM